MELSSASISSAVGRFAFSSFGWREIEYQDQEHGSDVVIYQFLFVNIFQTVIFWPKQKLGVFMIRFTMILFFRKIALLFIFICGTQQCLSGENLNNKKPEIHIFIHVCTINNWKPILLEQLNRIHASGLYDACKSISLGVLGDGNMSNFAKKYPKLTILFQSPNVGLYERPTLLACHEFCSSHADPDSLVLYLHTKGVTKTSPIVSANVRDWVNYMEYFTIDLWPNCVAALENYDVCGVNLYPVPALHFSGNFWWARAAYIATLPNTISPDYLAPEMWLVLS